MEIWKDIPGFEGRYQASTEGRIKSLLRKNPTIWDAKTSNWERPMLKLRDVNDKIHNMTHYTYIAITFLGLIPNGRDTTIHHIDGNPRNNRLDNLQIVTHRYNCTVDRKGFKNDLHNIYEEALIIMVHKKLMNFGKFKDIEFTKRFRDYIIENEKDLPKDKLNIVAYVCNKLGDFECNQYKSRKKLKYRIRLYQEQQ
jgi:hypothetical protein